MGPLGVVALKVVIEHGLHLLDVLKLGVPPFNPEMLVEQSAMETFKDEAPSRQGAGRSGHPPHGSGSSA
jgi:hypothetical protein